MKYEHKDLRKWTFNGKISFRFSQILQSWPQTVFKSAHFHFNTLHISVIMLKKQTRLAFAGVNQVATNFIYSFLSWVFFSHLLFVLNYSVQRDSRMLVTSSLIPFTLRSVDDVTFLLNCFSFLLRRSFLLWVFLSQLLFVLDSSDQSDSRMLVSRSLMTFTLSCWWCYILAEFYLAFFWAKARENGYISKKQYETTNSRSFLLELF